MAQIHITREHASSIKDAREAADQIADEMADRFGVTCEWDDNVLRFNHSAVNGQIVVSDCEIDIKAKLGLLVSPMRKPLEKAIHHYIDEYLDTV